MKKKIFGVLLCITILASSLIGVKTANTEPPALGGRMINGIGNVTVYIDSGSGATYWQRLIKDAVHNWMYTGFGAKANNILAATSWRASNMSYIEPRTTNWYSADMYLHDSGLRKNDISDAQATGTMAHELGHGFGMNENNSNPNSNMCQSLYRVVQKVDNDALNRLY